jgi:glutathione S-transferase
MSVQEATDGRKENGISAGIKLRLITITISHYCEKARWALERQGVPFLEEGHLGVLHLVSTRLAGGARTVPKLVIEKKGAGPVLLNESAEIVRFADENRVPGASTLFPDGKVEEIGSWVTKFDKLVGPHVRRWVYYYMLGSRFAFEIVNQGGTSWLEKAIFWVMWPLFKIMYTKTFNLTDAGCKRSLARLEEVFCEVDKVLADGRKYLTGNQFTAADLTLAALAYPVLLPPGVEAATYPPLDKLPVELENQVLAWRKRPFGQLVLRAYAEERSPRSAAEVGMASKTLKGL